MRAKRRCSPHTHSLYPSLSFGSVCLAPRCPWNPLDRLVITLQRFQAYVTSERNVLHISYACDSSLLSDAQKYPTVFNRVLHVRASLLAVDLASYSMLSQYEYMNAVMLLLDAVCAHGFFVNESCASYSCFGGPLSMAALHFALLPGRCVCFDCEHMVEGPPGAANDCYADCCEPIAAR